MECKFHPGQETVSTCILCWTPICPECLGDCNYFNYEALCPKCLNVIG